MVRQIGSRMLAAAVVAVLCVAASQALPAQAAAPAKPRVVVNYSSANGLVMAGQPTRLTVEGTSSATVYVTLLDSWNYSNPWDSLSTTTDWRRLGTATPKRGPSYTFKQPGYYGVLLRPSAGKNVLNEVQVYGRFAAGIDQGPTTFGDLIIDSSSLAWAGNGSDQVGVEAENGCRFVDVGVKTDVGSVAVTIRSEKARPVSLVATPGAPVAVTNVRVGGGSYVESTPMGGAGVDDSPVTVGTAWTCLSDPFPWAR